MGFIKNSVHLDLSFLSCLFLIESDNLNLSTGVFKPFTFNVIIDTVKLKYIILLAVSSLCSTVCTLPHTCSSFLSCLLSLVSFGSKGKKVFLSTASLNLKGMLFLVIPAISWVSSESQMHPNPFPWEPHFFPILLPCAWFTNSLRALVLAVYTHTIYIKDFISRGNTGAERDQTISWLSHSNFCSSPPGIYHKTTRERALHPLLYPCSEVPRKISIRQCGSAFVYSFRVLHCLFPVCLHSPTWPP